MNKAQAALFDALFFMFLAAGAAYLLLFVAANYAADTQNQVAFTYNYDYLSNVFVALHYLKDDSGNFFWLKFEEKLGKEEQSCNYLKDYFGLTKVTYDPNDHEKAKPILELLNASSPSDCFVLEIRENGCKIYVSGSEATCEESKERNQVIAYSTGISKGLKSYTLTLKVLR
ncbi:MAG: hypothetical protein QW735_00875 [archaeon]